MDVLRAGDDAVQRLIRHARHIEGLGRDIHALLEPPLQEHCRLTNVKDGTLVLHADSSAWAARLRFQMPAVLRQLRQHPAFTGVSGFRVRVAPLQRAAPVAPSSPRELSQETVSLIRSSADTVGDLRLKLALQRLADHASRKRRPRS